MTVNCIWFRRQINMMRTIITKCEWDETNKRQIKVKYIYILTPPMHIDCVHLVLLVVLLVFVAYVHLFFSFIFFFSFLGLLVRQFQFHLVCMQERWFFLQTIKDKPNLLLLFLRPLENPLFDTDFYRYINKCYCVYVHVYLCVCV